jgi:hypothetical protein
MATYDDYDGVYFSVQAIRLYHPEVTDRTEILVLDNHPSGPCAKPLKELERQVAGYRYVPYERSQGTAVRDLLFREANAEFVLCMDSHVLFRPGALARLVEYLASHPHASDLCQGPLMSDDLEVHATHFNPVWHGGMYGVWGKDSRGLDPDAPAFEIPMQGLGVFACRRAAWPGFNPRLRGFGGEEGYLHEKVRRAGGRTLCLPFLGWTHRFNRPFGPRYPVSVEDRVRNYLLVHDELRLDPGPAIAHLEQEFGAESVRPLVDRVEQELRGPFHFFDAIYCINLDRETGRWESVMRQCKALGIDHRIRRFAAIDTPASHGIGRRYPIAPSWPKPSGRAWSTCSCLKTTWSSRAGPRMCWRRASPSCATGSGACCRWAGATGTGRVQGCRATGFSRPPRGRCLCTPSRITTPPTMGS